MAPSTNFLQWNPAQSNQESDSAFSADALRTAGAQTDNIFQSPLANKLFYQLSTFVTAFANMLVTKGFSPYDTSLTNLSAIFANVLTTADTQASIVTVPYSANAIFNRAAGQSFYMLLTGNLTGPTLTNLAPGQVVTFMFQQDGTGGRVVTWPGQCVSPGTIDSTSAPNAVFIQSFIVIPPASLAFFSYDRLPV